jgi:hypothetical protein
MLDITIPVPFRESMITNFKRRISRSIRTTTPLLILFVIGIIGAILGLLVATIIQLFLNINKPPYKQAVSVLYTDPIFIICEIIGALTLIILVNNDLDLVNINIKYIKER